MITQNDIARLDGADVYDTDGDRIGSVGQVYLDAQSGDPAWVTVITGLFSTKETFVPLRSATIGDDQITVAYDKAQVKDAPQIDADGPMSHVEEDRLYNYYDLATSQDTTYQSDVTYQDRDDALPGSDDSGSMTRSEERLVAGTRTEDTGTARLRKYVVTEQQQITVPVSHQEVRLQREPITDANAGGAYDGPQITEAEHEITLHAERPLVTAKTVPVERVRLGTETVSDEQTVSGEVRKEQIEFDGPHGNDRR